MILYGGVFASPFTVIFFFTSLLLSSFPPSLVEGLDDLAESLISVLAIAMASGLFISLELRLRAFFGKGFPLTSPLFGS